MENIFRESIYMGNKFILKIIEKGLEIWVKSKCDKVDHIKLDISSSPLEILKGKIKRISLFAENIMFNDLYFRKIEITSGPIEFDLKIGPHSTPLSIKEDFKIRCNISLDNDNIYSALSNTKWQKLIMFIFNDDKGKYEINNLFIEDNKLILEKSGSGINLQEKFSISAEKGTILFHCDKTKKRFTLPMDTAIEITNAEARDNIILIDLYSKVII